MDGAAGPAAQARAGSPTARGWCYIIAVRLIGTVLANVMIFSGTVCYPIYRAGDAHWHISAIADQVSRRRA